MGTKSPCVITRYRSVPRCEIDAVPRSTLSCASNHARASCAELRSQLYVALDVAYLDRKTFAELLEKTKELGRILGGLRRAVREHRTSA